jgi:hypothetical protein
MKKILLKHKLLSVTLVLALVAGLGGWTAYRAFANGLAAQALKDSQHNQALFAATGAKEIEHYFTDIEKRLQTIALMPAVQNAQRSESCNQSLQDIVQVNSSDFNNLGRINKDGVFICAVNRTLIGEPASKYGTYFATIAKDPEHKPVMSRLIYPTGASGRVIGVHVPVYDARGQFTGTIGGAVYFDELEKRVLEGAKPTPHSHIVLFDDNLDILYHPDPLIRSKNLLSPEINQKFTPRDVITGFVEKIKNPPAEGSITYSFNGNSRQVAYKSAQVIGRHWTLGVVVPTDDIRQSTLRTNQSHMFGVVVALLALLVTSLPFVARLRQSNVKTSAKR